MKKGMCKSCIFSAFFLWIYCADQFFKEACQSEPAGSSTIWLIRKATVGSIEKIFPNVGSEVSRWKFCFNILDRIFNKWWKTSKCWMPLSSRYCLRIFFLLIFVSVPFGASLTRLQYLPMLLNHTHALREIRSAPLHDICSLQDLSGFSGFGSVVLSECSG